MEISEMKNVITKKKNTKNPLGILQSRMEMREDRIFELEDYLQKLYYVYTR